MFKKCTNCGQEWTDRKEFLSDPDVELLGYQVNFGELTAGFFLFHHGANGCWTSLAISAGDFVDMHKGPMFENCPRSEIPDCPRFCCDENSLDACYNKCECAYVRDVLQIVKKWPKRKVA